MADRPKDPDTPLGDSELDPHDSLSGARLTDPEQVGPYRILRCLGEGGMGVVYLAEQREPVRREVALKLIKVGMDTREVIARFESERQALALMNHPNIARVLDGGSSDAGRPYFVMEYVAGQPITGYCDEHRLDTRRRLELFGQVCQAIQHAHQKGIIHRDLKPSNVLVSRIDGKGVPKVIDFGVAKATAQRLTAKTFFTTSGQIVGTPEYMSPEQGSMTDGGIDTRTDVYSLGVLLYEMLVGALPFDREGLRDKAFDEVLRVIREEEPQRPSTRLDTMADSDAAAACRRTDSRSLARMLRGDLDWIVMKALEKEPGRRYASASELAADVRRFLEREPVSARPPSAAYQLRKLVGRHKLPFAFAATMLVVLVGVSVALSLLAGRIARERDRANLEAATANQVSDFMTGIFEVANPDEATGKVVTAKELLDRGAARIRDELDDQPRVQARMLTTMAEVYRRLGLFEQAEPLVRDGLALQRELGDDDLEVAESLAGLGRVLIDRGDFDAAADAFGEALEIRERRLPPGDALLASSLKELGDVRWNQGDYAGARELLERSLALQESDPEASEADLASTLLTLGAVHYRVGDYDRAIEVWQRTLVVQERVLSPEHPELAMTLNNLGLTMRTTGRSKEARPLLERALAIQQKSLGDDHPYVAYALSNLGEVLRDFGDDVGAVQYFERAVTIGEKEGRQHPELARFLYNLGMVRRDLQDLDAARRCFERALAIREVRLGPEHPETGMTLAALAVIDVLERKYDDAETRLARGLSVIEAALGPEHHYTAFALRESAVLFNIVGRLDEAQAYAHRALTIVEKGFGRDHMRTGDVLMTLAATDANRGDYASAEPSLRRVVSIREKWLGPTHRRTLIALSGLGQAVLRERRFTEAEAVLRSVLERAEAYPRDDLEPRWGHYHLALAVLGQGRRDEALRLLREAADRGLRTSAIEKEALLDAVRDDPAFAAVIARIRAGTA